MADEPDQQYQPWLRDSGNGDGSAGARKPPAAPSPDPAASSRRDVRSLSADELLARPAPLPTDVTPGPAAGERVRSGFDKVAGGLRAANERLEPGRRARAAGAAAAKAAGAAYREGKKAAGALGNTAAQAAGRARHAAAPRLRSAATAAKAGLSKTVAGAREGLDKGGKAARAQLGASAASAKQAVRAAIPERPVPTPPTSELDRLVEREGLPAAGAAATPTASPDLPLFGAAQSQDVTVVPPVPSLRAAPAASPAPSPAGSPAPPVLAAATAVPPSAPPAEALQDEAEAIAAPSGPTQSWQGVGAMWDTETLRDWARHPATWVLAALALTASGFALGRWTSGGTMNAAALGTAIDEHLLANPEIVPQAMERLQANRQAEAIGASRAALTTPFSGAWTGNAGGDVTMVVFTDYACTFCRASIADIARLEQADPNLKIVYRELPILSADSEAAARVALAAARRGRYMAVHRLLFRSQVPDAAARANALATSGVAIDAAATTDAAIDRELAANTALARELGIDGTPAFVIGDRLLVGAVGYDALRAAIGEARN